MKSYFSRSTFSKIQLIVIVSFSLVFLFLNITGCALSRQFIRTHTGHGYGTNFVNETYSDEWDVFEPAGSATDWAIDDRTDFISSSDCLVDESSDILILPGNDPHNLNFRSYPTPFRPRGIYTTGTGIIIIVDIYK